MKTTLTNNLTTTLTASEAFKAIQLCKFRDSLQSALTALKALHIV